MVLLQWGRIHADAEGRPPDVPGAPSRPLQWGRIHADAEGRSFSTGGSSHPLGFNGAASMRMRRG